MLVDLVPEGACRVCVCLWENGGNSNMLHRKYFEKVREKGGKIHSVEWYFRL